MPARIVCPPLDEHTTRSMKGNRRKDTSPELMLRKALREEGCSGYRLQWKVPGRPDICYPGKRVAVFVNGCFWHRCPSCDLPIPHHNSEYWTAKFEANVRRDAEKIRLLEEDGWTVIVAWECEIKKDAGSVAQRIKDAVTGGSKT